MQSGQQVFPHKYVKREKRGDKWFYVYADDPKKTKIDPTTEGLVEYKVVIAHQKPTPILINNQNSHIVFGPPQCLGRVLMVNKNPNKNYFGRAIDPDTNSAVYLYPEEFVQEIKAKKAAKFLKADQGLKLIDNTAEHMMRSQNPRHQKYGLVMWLNNHTGLRIGAHEEAASVDAGERRKIINQARAEGWSETAKRAALEAARKPTFGLLTTQAGHVDLDPQTHIARWSFRSKGGKMITGDNVAVKLPELQYFTLDRILSGKPPDAKLFDDVQYKHIWRYYSQYGLTPHIARGAYAESMMKTLKANFKRNDHESAQVAFSRFKKEVQTKISDKLGHTSDMTLKAYVSDNTRAALDAIFKSEVHDKAFTEAASTTDPTTAIANTLLWLEIGPGNAVI